MISKSGVNVASWEDLPDGEYKPMSEEEDEAHMDTMYSEMKEEYLKRQAIELKPLVFSDSSPGPKDPFKFFSHQIFTHAYDTGVISAWDIVFYRRCSHLSKVSRKQMNHKVRIDLLIRAYFLNV